MGDAFDAACLCKGNYVDSDLDGVCDTSDGCPGDPLKTDPGSCGCGNADPGTPCDDGITSTIRDVMTSCGVCQGSPFVELFAYVMLEGADPDGLMSDHLRQQGLVPNTEPYTAMGYGFSNGGAGAAAAPEQLAIAGSSNSVVDWVVVELRSPTYPYPVIDSEPGLLRRNGQVHMRSTGGPMRFTVPGGDYMVAIRHRNHLGVITAAPVQLGASTQGVADFMNPFNVIALGGPSSMKFIPPSTPFQYGNYALIAGDVSFDGTISYTGPGNDRDRVLTAIGGISPTSTVAGYYDADVNLDGVVKYTGADNDRDVILQNIGGVVPTTVIQDQIP
jgi:hypothetical protein